MRACDPKNGRNSHLDYIINIYYVLLNKCKTDLYFLHEFPMHNNGHLRVRRFVRVANRVVNVKLFLFTFLGFFVIFFEQF